MDVIHQLKWPEKLVIYDLTATFQDNLDELRVQDFMNSSTSWAAKCSFLYLLDSLLKNTDDENKLQRIYGAIYETLEAFRQVKEPIPDCYGRRFEFIMSSWEKRLLHCVEWIDQLRDISNTLATPHAQNSSTQVPKNARKIWTFLNQRQISLDSFVLDDISTQMKYLQSDISSGKNVNKLPDVVSLVDKKMSHLIESCKYVDNALPKSVSGRLPLSSSEVSMFLEVMNNQDCLVVSNSSTSMENNPHVANHPGVSVPKIVERKISFVTESLGRVPDKVVSSLYDQKYISKQDGLRFLHENDLSDHLNLLFSKNSEMKGRLSGRICRLFYDPAEEWVKDSSARNKKLLSTEKSTDEVEGSTKMDDSLTEMIIPADEKFEKCPISKEKFSIVSHNEEVFYRDAAKLFLLPCDNVVDHDLYKFGCVVNDHIKYLIVSKTLVLDEMVEKGTVETVKSYLNKFERHGSIFESILSALEGDDEEDVFIYPASEFS